MILMLEKKKKKKGFHNFTRRLQPTINNYQATKLAHWRHFNPPKSTESSHKKDNHKSFRKCNRSDPHHAGGGINNPRLIQ